MRSYPVTAPKRPPRLYADHLFAYGTRCRVRPENCGSFSTARISLRDSACLHCRRCMGCVYDLERCTSESSRVSTTPGTEGPGDSPLSGSPAPGPSPNPRTRP